MDRKTRRRGSYALEFALVLPVLVAAIGGIVEYGHFYDQQVSMIGILRNAGRAGAMTRQEAVPSPPDAAIAVIKEGVLAQGYQGTLTVDARLSGAAPDQLITVSASIPYKPLIGFVPTPRVISHTIVMRMNDQP